MTKRNHPGGSRLLSSGERQLFRELLHVPRHPPVLASSRLRLLLIGRQGEGGYRKRGKATEGEIRSLYQAVGVDASGPLFVRERGD